MAPRPPADPRHRAREVALKILYEWEISGEDLEAVLESWSVVRPYLLADGTEVVWPQLDEHTWALVTQLTRGVAERLGEVDGLIERRTENWRLERMSVIDRLILRLAVFEMLRDPVLGRGVVINEALELAHTFSTEAAVKFVNGVLDGIGRDLADTSRGAPGSRAPGDER